MSIKKRVHTGVGVLGLGLCLAMVSTTIGLTPVSASAAETQLDRLVSANPENWTPNVNDGRVNAVVQIGNKIIAVGARKMFEGYPAAISPLVYRWNGAGFVAWGDARPRDPTAPTR